MSEGIRSIPLSKLMPSEENVRHTNASAELDELIASIKAHGLLQNLTVRRVRKSNGKPSGSFEVVAGGRRLVALTTLATEGHIGKNYPVPCQVLDGQSPTEISLAENYLLRLRHESSPHSLPGDIPQRHSCARRALPRQRLSWSAHEKENGGAHRGVDHSTIYGNHNIGHTDLF